MVLTAWLRMEVPLCRVVMSPRSGAGVASDAMPGGLVLYICVSSRGRATRSQPRTNIVTASPRLGSGFLIFLRRWRERSSA